MHAVDDLSRRSLRELLTLARERLGRRAAGLKTRGELIAALRQDDAAGGARAASVVSRGGVAASAGGPAGTAPFDLAATGGGAMANAPERAIRGADAGTAKAAPAEVASNVAAGPAPAVGGAGVGGARGSFSEPSRVASPVVSPAEPPRAGDVPTVVTRDFFIARH